MMTALGYAGDIDVVQAWQMLDSNGDAVLVDVRTAAEWRFVGVPDLGGLGKRPVLVEWQRFPDGAPDPDFLGEVAAAGVPTTAPVLLLCRSGQRSRVAAMALTAQGYERCFNVAGGFEGQKDEQGHRGTVDGWKVAGLPWQQG